MLQRKKYLASHIQILLAELLHFLSFVQHFANALLCHSSHIAPVKETRVTFLVSSSVCGSEIQSPQLVTAETSRPCRKVQQHLGWQTITAHRSANWWWKIQSGLRWKFLMIKSERFRNSFFGVRGGKKLTTYETELSMFMKRIVRSSG